ncbi:PA2779 family protein [Pseudomonas zhanjiangensis]|uniref:PA2779 family protein n=1 Tax=Pseudomonas zhanjiangensis TaxID=3239015 RepID=A0ABV3YU78_9PSED
MKVPSIRCKLVITVLAASMLAATSLPSYSGMIGTQEALAEHDHSADRDKLQAFLDRDDVRAQLLAMDVPPAAAKERVNALTSSEAASLAQRIDTLPAAGALSGNDFVIILLVAILVALIL